MTHCQDAFAQNTQNTFKKLEITHENQNMGLWQRMQKCKCSVWHQMVCNFPCGAVCVTMCNLLCGTLCVTFRVVPFGIKLHRVVPCLSLCATFRAVPCVSLSVWRRLVACGIVCNFSCGPVCVTVCNRIGGKINTKLPTSDARPPFNDTSDAQDALAKMWELFQMRRRYQLKVIWRRMFDASANILKIHFWLSYYFPGLFLYFFLICSMTRPSRSMEDKYGNECKKDLKTKRKKI